MHYLVVVRSFGSFRVGDVISDEDTIQKVLDSEHCDHVVRILPPKEA